MINHAKGQGKYDADWIMLANMQADNHFHSLGNNGQQYPTRQAPHPQALAQHGQARFPTGPKYPISKSNTPLSPPPYSISTRSLVQKAPRGSSFGKTHIFANLTPNAHHPTQHYFLCPGHDLVVQTGGRRQIKNKENFPNQLRSPTLASTRYANRSPRPWLTVYPVTNQLLRWAAFASKHTEI